MLRALNAPDDRPRRPAAYRVPWSVQRVLDTHPLVTNAGSQALDVVRVFVHSGGAPPATESWGRVLPGETVEICLCAVDPGDAVVTIAWYRPDDGVEYVWRFVV